MKLKRNGDAAGHDALQHASGLSHRGRMQTVSVAPHIYGPCGCPCRRHHRCYQCYLYRPRRRCLCCRCRPRRCRAHHFIIAVIVMFGQVVDGIVEVLDYDHCSQPCCLVVQYCGER